MRLFVGLLILGMWAGLGAPSAFGQAPPAQKPAEEASPEEPDFAFVTGGPFTQVKNSLQFIQQFGYGTRRFNTAGGRVNEDEFLFFLRTE